MVEGILLGVLLGGSGVLGSVGWLDVRSSLGFVIRDRLQSRTIVCRAWGAWWCRCLFLCELRSALPKSNLLGLGGGGGGRGLLRLGGSSTCNGLKTMEYRERRT